MLEFLFWLCAFGIVYPYLIYPIILSVLSFFRKPKVLGRPSNFPSVSMIIAAYNEEAVIEEKIRNSLDLFHNGTLEIIVASDGSTDKTNEIVSKYPTVRLLAFPKREGKASLLNKSIPEASGEIVVLSDANTMYGREAIDRLLAPFADSRVGCVCGRLQPVVIESSVGGEGERFHQLFDSYLKTIEGLFGATAGADGGLYAIRKTLYEPIPASTITDDLIVSMRIAEKGHRVVYEREAVGLEETSSTEGEFRRRVRIGAGDYQALVMLRRLLNPFRGFVSFSFWSHKVLKWLGPLFLLGCLMSTVLLLHLPLYRFLFFLQVAFYLFALTGHFFRRLGVRILTLPGSFALANTALFCGFVKFAAGLQKPTWTPVKRNLYTKPNNPGDAETIVEPEE